jgi:chromosome partitioning protein
MLDTGLVMKGSLGDFELADVLQVVGLSRQLTAIEVRLDDGSHYGTIWVKSGRVVNARRGPTQGKLAFYDMFAPRKATFLVSRLADLPAFPEPIGAVASLLLEARAPVGPPSVGPPPPRPATLPRPPPTLARASQPTAPVVTGPLGVAIAVSSPKGGVGKTTVALNLALSLAQRGLRVILVDADVNGDALSLLDARAEVTLGALDILDCPDLLDGTLRATAVPGLRLLPACGTESSADALVGRGARARWQRLLEQTRGRADVTLVDCPAGMLGTTGDVLGACTHVIGVVQSQVVAQRSFEMFHRGLELVAAERRPELVGVLINMFQRRSGPSLEAFHAICADGSHRLFETIIPRADAFDDSSLAGRPLRFGDGRELAPLAWLFDMLASEVCDRTRLEPLLPPGKKTFLL